MNDGGRVQVATFPAAAPATPIPAAIDRARAGDRAAFAELYEEHVAAVYRYVVYRVQEPADAEDITSEVFTRAFAAIHRYRWQGKSFLAWLYTIARNAITDRRRRARPTMDIEEAYGLAADGPTAHDRAVLGEDVSALKGALHLLTEEQRTVLELRFAGDLSSAQVARRMGKNEGAVRALQFRALAHLRKILSDRG